MQSRDLVLAAVGALPLPGAPPRLSRSNSWVGLAFLDTALRQNHVRRLGETLELSEHRVSNRVVELDISLNLLDDVQCEAGLAYSDIRTRRAHATPAAASDRLLWVPVARTSRRSISPVEVFDSAGKPVPRLTQFESAGLFASGMYQLLRSILEAQPSARQPGSPLHRFLGHGNHARWLLQSAMLALFGERAAPTRPEPVEPPVGDVKHGPLWHQRDLVAQVLMADEPALRDYFRLLDVSLQQYLVVVGLPSDKDEHRLTYTVPLQTVPEPPAGRVAGLFRQLAPSRRGYRVCYTATVPGTVRSYHLVASTDPSLLVRKLVLSSDADEQAALGLAKDLSDLSGRLSHHRAETVEPWALKILELELETTARALGQLVRRRTWEAQHAGGVLDAKRTGAVRRLAAESNSGDAHPVGDQHRTSLLVNPKVTPRLLENAAGELRESRLGLDVSHQNDPVTNRANAYWRQHASFGPAPDPLRLTSSILVTDGTAGAREVGRFVLAVALVTFVIASAAFGGLLPWRWAGNAQPLPATGTTIAVLLLVPGYLYNRLDRPYRRSIAFRLRTLPRACAYVCIGSVALLAAYLTSEPNTTGVRLAVWVALTVQLLLAGSLLLRIRSRRSPSRADREVATSAPPWFRADKGPGRHAGTGPTYDVLYQSEQ